MVLDVVHKVDSAFETSKELGQGISAEKVTEAVSINGYSFQPTNSSSIVYRPDQTGKIALAELGVGTVTALVTPLNIPHGATITSILVKGTTVGAETWSIGRYDMIGIDAELTLLTGSINTKKVANITINNERFTYFIWTSILALEDDIDGVLLEYAR